MAELSMAQLLSIPRDVIKIEIEGKKKDGDKKAPIIGEIYVTEFTSKDRRDVHKLIKGDETRIPAAYVIYGVCNKKGERKFVETDDKDIESLIDEIAAMPDLIVGQMLAAVMKVNSTDEKETAKN